MADVMKYDDFKSEGSETAVKVFMRLDVESYIYNALARDATRISFWWGCWKGGYIFVHKTIKIKCKRLVICFYFVLIKKVIVETKGIH